MVDFTQDQKPLNSSYCSYSDINALTEILVTNGAYMALYTIVQALINPGDEVIIIEPFFDCYAPMVRLAGGDPVFVALEPVNDHSSDWKLDLSKVPKSDKLKAIIINNPNNPLGKVYSLSELENVARFCKEQNIVCISDEVYEHLVYR